MYVCVYVLFPILTRELCAGTSIIFRWLFWSTSRVFLLEELVLYVAEGSSRIIGLRKLSSSTRLSGTRVRRPCESWYRSRCRETELVFKCWPGGGGTLVTVSMVWTCGIQACRGFDFWPRIFRQISNKSIPLATIAKTTKRGATGKCVLTIVRIHSVKKRLQLEKIFKFGNCGKLLSAHWWFVVKT